MFTKTYNWNCIVLLSFNFPTKVIGGVRVVKRRVEIRDGRLTWYLGSFRTYFFLWWFIQSGLPFSPYNSLFKCLYVPLKRNQTWDLLLQNITKSVTFMNVHPLPCLLVYNCTLSYHVMSTYPYVKVQSFWWYKLQTKMVKPTQYIGKTFWFNVFLISLPNYCITCISLIVVLIPVFVPYLVDDKNTQILTVRRL